MKLLFLSTKILPIGTVIIFLMLSLSMWSVYMERKHPDKKDEYNFKSEIGAFGLMSLVFVGLVSYVGYLICGLL